MVLFLVVLPILANSFFRSELSWDGVIAAVALAVGVLGYLGSYMYRKYRRSLTLHYSTGPYNHSDKPGALYKRLSQ